MITVYVGVRPAKISVTTVTVYLYLLYSVLLFIHLSERIFVVQMIHYINGRAFMLYPEFSFKFIIHVLKCRAAPRNTLQQGI